MLRKLNTIILIPIILLALVHLLLMAGLLTFIIPFNPYFKYISYAFILLLAVHAAICILLEICRVTKREHKQKKYRGENKALAIQIITGVLMLILMYFHLGAYGYTDASGAFILRDPTLQYLILESLFALTIFVHCVISIPRLGITLGLLKSKGGLKKVFAANTIVCLLCLLLALFAYGSYYLPTVLGGLL